MSGRGHVFIYAATYSDAAGAYADYEALLDLHAASLVGTYRRRTGHRGRGRQGPRQKHEKPTQHGALGAAWRGRAAVGVLAAPAVIPAALVGGVIGGLGGHFKRGISRRRRQGSSAT